MDDNTDHALIVRTLEGDHGAFDELMLRHEKAVYRVAFGLTRSRESALDVTQAVFLKVFSHLRSFGGQSALRTWILSIASNESLTWLDRHKREALRWHPLEDAGVLPDSRPGPEKDLQSTEDVSRLRALIETLVDRQRLAIVLRYFEGCSLDEIASVLRCSQPVAKNTLYRAHQQLRKLWRRGSRHGESTSLRFGRIWRRSR